MDIKQPAGHHLAQINVGRALGAPDSEVMARFMNNLDLVNGIAERSPGFVWRLTGDGNNATDIQTTPDPLFLVNVSVWETAEAFEHFVWNTVHKKFYNEKARWFEKMKTPHFVMWWVPAGHQPTTDEALSCLQHYTDHGPSERAFGWESLPNIRLWMSQHCA